MSRFTDEMWLLDVAMRKPDGTELRLKYAFDREQVETLRLPQSPPALLDFAREFDLRALFERRASLSKAIATGIAERILAAMSGEP